MKYIENKITYIVIFMKVKLEIGNRSGGIYTDPVF